MGALNRRYPVAVLLLASVALTGCLGADGNHANSSRHGATGRTAQGFENTSIRLTYPLATANHRRSSALSTCPLGARCATLPVMELAGRSVWARQATLTLQCHTPPSGSYADPAEACRALVDIARRIKNRHSACPCALTPENLKPHVVGVIDGHRLSFSLDGCTLCGLGSQARHDAKVLIPTASTS
jgi:hypothetical protein